MRRLTISKIKPTQWIEWLPEISAWTFTLVILIFERNIRFITGYVVGVMVFYLWREMFEAAISRLLYKKPKPEQPKNSIRAS